MIFGAGRGTRMRPITDHTPKPLAPVNGRPIIDYALEKLAEYGIERVVVNTHHLAEKLEAYLKGLWESENPVLSPQPPASFEIITVREKTLLETGGGLVNALPWLGEEEPFFVINGDVIWQDGAEPTLLRLQKAYDPERMDALLLLVKREEARGYEGDGDFTLSSGGVLSKNGRGKQPYVFSGIQIMHPKFLAGYAAEPFSLSRIYRKKTLHGIAHTGKWWHIGTQEGLERALRVDDA